MSHTTNAGRTYEAGAIVNPKRLLTLSAARTVIQASADSNVLFGVSGEDARRYDDAAHANAGEQASVSVLDGSELKVEAGGTVAVGEFVTADADGRAVTATLEDVSSAENATTVYAIGPVIKGGAVGEEIVVAANLITGRKVTA